MDTGAIADALPTATANRSTLPRMARGLRLQGIGISSARSPDSYEHSRATVLASHTPPAPTRAWLLLGV